MERFKDWLPKMFAAFKRKEVILDPMMSEVVFRLTTLLPDSLVHELYTSKPKETRGKSKFPYCRVDIELIICSSNIDLFNRYGAKSNEEFIEIYTKACKSAFSAIVWVEIGFQGIDNLANHSASINWTSAVGHSLSAEERAARIKTAGKALYIRNLQRFKQFRLTHRISSDLFSQHGLEYLLDLF